MILKSFDKGLLMRIILIDLFLTPYFYSNIKYQDVFARNHIFHYLPKIKSARKLNIKYKDMKITEYSRATYFGCVLD